MMKLEARHVMIDHETTDQGLILFIEVSLNLSVEELGEMMNFNC